MSRPLRIALATTFYPPMNFGGDGITVERFARALVRDGHEVTVIHDADAFRAMGGQADPDTMRPAVRDGVTVVPVGTDWPWLSSVLTHQLGRPLLKQSALSAALGREFDVVHFHNVSLLGGPGALETVGRVRLYTAHEHWLVCPTHVLWKNGTAPCESQSCISCSLRQRRPPQWWRFSSLLTRRLAKMHALIALSEFSRERHRRFGMRQPMQVIPPFVPDAVPARRGTDLPPQVQQVLADASPFVLYVGRLETAKGVDDIVPPFTDERVNPAVRLVVVGDGTQRTRLELATRAHPRIVMLGRQESATIDALRDRAVAQIVPSRGYETFGLVIAEAMQRGTPVIARRIGPFPELLARAGTGVLYDTPDELVSALRRAVTSDDWRAAARRDGPRAVDTHWSESAVMPQYTSLLDRLGAWSTPTAGLPRPSAVLA